jgi:hypothetical protein
VHIVLLINTARFFESERRNMNAIENKNGWERVPTGRIRMQITSFLATERGNFEAINRDTSIKADDVSLLVNHVTEMCDIKVPALPQKPRHGWKVSTLVGFIHENQQPKAET